MVFCIAQYVYSLPNEKLITHGAHFKKTASATFPIERVGKLWHVNNHAWMVIITFH